MKAESRVGASEKTCGAGGRAYRLESFETTESANWIPATMAGNHVRLLELQL
jgi:hypothetical protein